MTAATRRDVLAAALAAAAGVLAPGRLWAGARDLRAVRLSGDILVIGGAGGNVVAARGADGMLMVDGGLVTHTENLLGRIAAELGPAPVSVLLNTHWHWDHTGANEALARTGARIVAHENTRLWLGAEIVSKWENRTYPPRPAVALPRETFYYGGGQVDLGTHAAEYGFLPQAHTDGDIYVFFPERNVLVGGDVVSGGGYPLLDYSTGGWIGGMIDALRKLIDLTDEDTRIVPGSGPLRSRSDLQAQLDMCLSVTGRIAQSYYKGETWEEFLASRPTREFDARFAAGAVPPATFLHTAYTGAWGHINEMRRFTR